MSKELHDIDELFRSALDEYEAIPSAGLKENLDAALDKQQAEKYKKRFIIWKRTALLLLLLVAGLVIYESGLLKKETGYYTSNKSTGENEKQPGAKTKSILQDKNVPINTNSNSSDTNRSLPESNTATKQQGQRNTAPLPEAFFMIETRTASPKRKHPGKQEDFITQRQDIFFPITSLPALKKTNDPIDNNTNWEAGKPVIKKAGTRISIARLAKNLFNNTMPPFQFLVRNSPTISTNNKNSVMKKINLFNPSWTITPFISYDQAGYILDSNEPSAISSIKFREANEPSYSAGFLLARQLTPLFSLQSGIIYRNTAIGMKPQKTYAFVDPTGDVAYKYITSSGYAYFKPGFGPQPTVGDSLTTAEAKHTLENISVPFMAKYTVLNKKISVTPAIGIEANFITKANLEVDIEDPFNREIVVVKRLNGTKPFYWSFIAGAEIKYTVNKKVSINILPVYRQAISPITKNNVVETFPRSFGIGAGLTIKL